VHKVGGYILLLVMLLTIVFTFIRVNAEVNNELFHEQLDIYTYGTVTLLDLKIYDHPIITQNFKNVFSFLGNKTFKICYSNIPRWSPEYNYLLSGEVFNDTYLKRIPFTGMIITVGNTTYNEKLINDFGDIFKTYFLIDGDNLLGYTDFKIFLSVYNQIISLPKYTRFLSWMDPTSFSPDNDLFMVIFYRSGNNSLLRIVILKDLRVKYFYWSLDKFVNYRASTPYIGYNYTSTLNIFFKDVFIEKKPVNVTVINEDNVNRYYVYRVEANSSEDFINPHFKIRYETPALLVTRFFNSTTFYYGKDIEVGVSVKNLMSYPVHDINLSESRWWSGIGEIVKGNTSVIIKDLKGNSEYTMRYIIRIITQNHTWVLVKPAEAILTSETGYKECLYSNTNIIYINYDSSPLISTSIQSIDTKDLSFGKSIKYIAIISNMGNDSVGSVVFGNFIIGDLRPGETRKIEGQISSSLMKRHHVDLVVNASYIYQGNMFNLSTQFLPLNLYPLKYDKPWINMEYDFSKQANNTVFLHLKITNNGLYDVKKVDLHIKPYASIYESGDFSSNLTYKKDVLQVNSTIDLNATFIYPNDTISFLPRIVLSFSDSPSNISSNIDYFYNTISASLKLPKQPYLMSKNYTLTINIENKGDSKLYNLTISFSPSILVIEPQSMNYSLINPFSNKTFSFTFISNSTGNFTFPEIKYDYWYLGSMREDEINAVNVSFYKGVWAECKAPDNIEEGKNFTLTVVIFTDSVNYISNVIMNLSLPQGLTFADGSSEKLITLDIGSKKTEINLNIEALAPGTYKLHNIKINYEFSGMKVDYVIKSENLPTIVVKENLIMRYWIYFIPMLIVALFYGFYLRRKII